MTKEEQLGIGGKIGTGLGLIGKRLVEKRYGFLARFTGSKELVDEGRVFGAKAEKIVKRVVKKRLDRLTTEESKKDTS